MTGPGISSAQRLRRQRDFQAVRQDGESRAHPLLVMRARRNALPHPRFGFIISKRVSKLAVTRNRIRRRLREIVRAMRFQEGWDIVIIARQTTPDARFDSLQTVTASLARRLRVLAPPPEERPAENGAAERDA